MQNADGGWGDVPKQPSNADVTGSAMQAIPGTKAAESGLSYLRKHQHSGGGFALGGSGAVNAQSTAWAVQGMIAVGADPAKVDAGGSSALDYLATLQGGDGHYRYSESSNQTPVWVTSQVLVAVAGESLPISPPPREKETAAVSPSKAAPTPPGVSEGSAAPAAPAAPVESAPPSTGGGSGAAPPAPGSGSGEPPVLPGSGGTPEAEGEGAPPGATAPASTPVATDGSSTSPLPPIGVGLAAGALALGLPWWLGRRYGW